MCMSVIVFVLVNMHWLMCMCFYSRVVHMVNVQYATEVFKGLSTAFYSLQILQFKRQYLVLLGACYFQIICLLLN